MACPAFGSTSNVAVYWATDADPTAAIPTDQTWIGINVTGESFDQSLTSTISEAINSTRSYADSVLTQGQSTGGFNFELSYENYDEFLLAALQSSTTTWASAASITNESTVHCLMFLVTVLVGATTYYYTYRGCQVDSLSLSLEPGSLVTGSVAVMGLSSAVDTGPHASWVLTPADTTQPLMSTSGDIQNFTLTDSTPTAVAATIQSMNITFSNSLRSQFAVSSESIYAAGIAPSRFSAEITTSMYFQNADMYDIFLTNDYMLLDFDLIDSAGNTINIDFNKLKPQSGVTPQAGGPDQDLMISPTLRAFQAAAGGTVTITKTDA